MMCSDGKKRIVLLINGSEGSAGGMRASNLFLRLQDRYQADYFYRSGSKISSLCRFLRHIWSLNPDLVYVVDTAISGAGAAILGRLSRRTPFVIDTGDLGYELAELTATPGWTGRRVINLVESSALRLASGIVVRGTFHKELLEGVGLRNVHLVRDGIGTEPASFDKVEILRQTLGLNDRLCVGMMGSIKINRRYGMCYGWDLVEALALLPPNLPVCGLIVGDGDGLPVLQRRTMELGLENRIHFVGRIPYADVGTYLGLMDVALSTQTNNRVGQVRTTGKLPEYMAAGCYVLATDVGEARLLLPPEMRLPYNGVIDRAYPERLAAKITELVGEPRERLRETVIETKIRAQEDLSYSHLSCRMDQVLQSVFRVMEARKAL